MTENHEKTGARSPQVSVIMAAYNAGATIERALRSVQAQTLANWELIVIDDGSTDSTSAIIDRYGQEDRRIRAVHQPNAGISAVRRRGVELARGEYVIHFDSDDYAEPGMLAGMLAEARAGGADVTVAWFFEDFYGGRVATRPQKLPSESAQEVIRGLFDGTLHGALWNKLIKADAYRRFRVDFSEGLWIGEDMLAVMKMARGGATFRFMEKAYYHYCYNNPASLTTAPGMASYLRRKQWIAACEKYAGEEFAYAIDSRKANAVFFALIHGLCDRREFYSYAPRGLRRFRGLLGSRRYLPGMWLAGLGLFSAGRLWCRMIKRLAR